jgi:glyoxylase-like metal-dependent hydrolase (beta-lactamase superfamily II)
MELFFCGDTAMSNSLTLLLGTKYHTIFVNDLDQYYNSWQKLIDSEAQEIYPGHGKPFSIEKLKENIYWEKIKHFFDKIKATKRLRILKGAGHFPIELPGLKQLGIELLRLIEKVINCIIKCTV